MVEKQPDNADPGEHNRSSTIPLGVSDHPAVDFPLAIMAGRRWLLSFGNGRLKPSSISTTGQIHETSKRRLPAGA